MPQATQEHQPVKSHTTRDRILNGTAELFRRQGYAGTGMKQIAAQANAPFGSVYHFFPGGKEQLGAEVIRTSGRMYMQMFTAIAAHSPDPVTTVEWFFAGAAQILTETDYANACPIATVALEVANTNETLRAATAEAFEEWIAGAAAYFAEYGIPAARSRELALEMLCMLEGAFLFSRSMRSTKPVILAGKRIAATMQEAVDPQGPS